MFAVNGMSLAKAMLTMATASGPLLEEFSIAPRIDKSSDSALESAVKNIIKQMIQFHPGDRLSMEEVVQKLTEVIAQHAPHVIATPASAPAGNCHNS